MSGLEFLRLLIRLDFFGGTDGDALSQRIQVQVYKADPPKGSRTRRKWVRLFMGRASKRRIWPMVARSFSFRRLFRISVLEGVFRLSFFILGPFQNIQRSKILGPAKGPFAANNILQVSHPKLMATK